MSLPRIAYADFIRQIRLDLDSLEFEKTPLLLDGEPCIYAGHHYESLVWLKFGNKVRRYHQADVMGHLRRAE